MLKMPRVELAISTCRVGKVRASSLLFLRVAFSISPLKEFWLRKRGSNTLAFPALILCSYPCFNHSAKVRRCKGISKQIYAKKHTQKHIKTHKNTTPCHRATVPLCICVSCQERKFIFYIIYNINIIYNIKYKIRN